MAAVLACRPRSYLSHRSALSLHGLADPAGEAEPIDVLVAGRRVRGRAGIRTHHVTRLDDDETTTFDGIPTTTLGRTLVDFAASAPARHVEAAVARAERERLITPDQLNRLPDRYAGVPGIVTLRAVLDAVGGPALTRSEAEARFLEMVRAEGLPIPEANATVAGCEIDFYWPRERFAVEVDGYRWHSSRPSFERDRHRSVRLAATGVHVVRLTWRQIVDDEQQTAALLRRALALAGARPW
jgi:very-short-patch-repair endonuclease